MTDDAMQIRALVSRWADAVHAGDLDIVALGPPGSGCGDRLGSQIQ
jgi:hypothetical protein